MAIIEGTAADKLIKVLDKIPEKQGTIVTEITLSMANSMQKKVRSYFPKARRIIDRIQVQKLAYDTLQEMRIDYRWDAINEETIATENAKADEVKYIPEVMSDDYTKSNFFHIVYLYCLNQVTNRHVNKRRMPQYYLASILM